MLELELEEEAERLREEEEQCEAAEMQVLSSSPQPGKTTSTVGTHWPDSISSEWFHMSSITVLY